MKMPKPWWNCIKWMPTMQLLLNPNQLLQLGQKRGHDLIISRLNLSIILYFSVYTYSRICAYTCFRGPLAAVFVWSQWFLA